MTLDLQKLKAHCDAAAKNKSDVAMIDCVDILDCIAEIERLRERLEWIAQQGCYRFEENGEMDCDQTTDCITEWCLPCYARKALEQG